MLIPDEIRKCVVFLCCRSPSGMQLSGTAFVVAEAVANNDGAFGYAVTAKHVIDAIRRKSVDEKVYFRFNLSNGRFALEPSDIKSWIFDPNDLSVDVAVLPFGPPSEGDCLAYPLSAAATDDRIPRLGIGIGDEVFLVGLFVNHAGSKKNIPIVRIGNIAAMPEEPVQTEQGLMDAYLIEARSIGGLSGSPVFVHLPPARFREGKLKLLQSDYFYLLGLVHGHWDLPVSDADTIGGDASNKEAINMGIAIVVPVSKILQVINHPELNKMKGKQGAN